MSKKPQKKSPMSAGGRGRYTPEFRQEAVCGRDGGYPPPPAQIRTCGITAYGSCLGF